jgi:argininosuccinate lyase
MWTIDGLIDTVTAATQAALTADRLAEDWLVFTSPGFGFISLDASLCRASVLMPQKRNPYALSVIRAGTSSLAGRLTGVVTTARTPSASTDNWLHSYGEVAAAVDLARRVVALAAAAVETVTVDEEALARAAQQEQVFATDLADEVVIRTGIDYRTSYRLVGRTLAHALETGSAVTSAALQAEADDMDVPVRGLETVDPTALRDPVAVVASRTEQGGSSPEAVRTEVAALRPMFHQAGAWCRERRAANAAARHELYARAEERARRSEDA